MPLRYAVYVKHICGPGGLAALPASFSFQKFFIAGDVRRTIWFALGCMSMLCCFETIAGMLQSSRRKIGLTWVDSIW
jgi:hypothetical protein